MGLYHDNLDYQNLQSWNKGLGTNMPTKYLIAYP